MKPENLKQAFNLFCTDSIHRTTLNAPFISTDYVCATDGHSLIFADKEKFNTHINADTREDTPSIEKVIPEEPHSPIHFSISLLEQQLDLKCKKEDEFTIPQKQCTQCNGYGEVECDLGHEHECPRCDGSGYQDKPRKTGNEIISPDTIISFLGDIFRGSQINKLIAACNILGVDNIIKLTRCKAFVHQFQVDEISIITASYQPEEDDIIVELDLDIKSVEVKP